MLVEGKGRTVRMLRRFYYLAIFLLIAVLSGCTASVTMSAEEIINNAIDAQKEELDYYAEAEVLVKENGVLVNKIQFSEYQKGNNAKYIMEDKQTGDEIELLQEGRMLTYYNKKKNDAFTLELDDSLDLMNQMNPKEELERTLEMMKDSHERKVMKEEVHLNRDVYHIHLKAKDLNSLFGDMDVWVDKLTWMIVKISSESGSAEIAATYTKLDFSPAFKENTFTLNIPENLKIRELDATMDIMSSETTIDEIVTLLGNEILLLNDTDWALVDLAKYDTIDGHEFELVYRKEDVHQLRVHITESPKEDRLALDPDGKVHVRGQVALADKGLSMVLWDEAGLRYTITHDHPYYTLDDIKELAEDMKWSSK